MLRVASDPFKLSVIMLNDVMLSAMALNIGCPIGRLSQGL